MGRVIKVALVGQINPGLTGRPRLAGPPAQSPSITQIVTRIAPYDGARLWGELHRRALAWTGSDDSAWLAQMRLRLPCGECRRHWDEMQARTPPDWANYFAWTVVTHNQVNQRLGKAVISEADARSIWGAATPV